MKHNHPKNVEWITQFIIKSSRKALVINKLK